MAADTTSLMTICVAYVVEDDAFEGRPLKDPCCGGPVRAAIHACCEEGGKTNGGLQTRWSDRAVVPVFRSQR